MLPIVKVELVKLDIEVEISLVANSNDAATA